LSGDGRPAEAAVAVLVARARAEPVPVIALTDEELAALDGGPGAPPVAPRPWLDQQDEASRELVCQVAFRGLAARGIVVPTGAVENGGRAVVAMHQDLRAVLMMRHDALALVAARRQGTDESADRVLFLHEDGAVLEEDVSPHGVHRLTVTCAATAAERLAAFVDPAGAAGERRPEPTRPVSLAEVAAGDGLPRVDDVRYLTLVGRLTAPAFEGAALPDVRRLTVYALPDRVVVAEPAALSSGETGLTLAAVGAAALRARLAALLDAAPAQGA
jgi:hypothetical protein